MQLVRQDDERLDVSRVRQDSWSLLVLSPRRFNNFDDLEKFWRTMGALLGVEFEPMGDDVAIRLKVFNGDEREYLATEDGIFDVTLSGSAG